MLHSSLSSRCYVKIRVSSRNLVSPMPTIALKRNSLPERQTGVELESRYASAVLTDLRKDSDEEPIT
jgi:hypothetical protein